MRHDVERHIDPLTEPVLLILLSLAEEPRHGFAMLKDIEELSGGRVRLSTGTLYGAIRRMLDDAWIEPHVEEDAPRGRQAYQLTSIGRRVLQGEIGRMKLLARVANVRLSRGEA
jgi:DNA-binding PadR family transcriptional regulator